MKPLWRFLGAAGMLIAGCATTGQDHADQIEARLSGAKVVASFRDVPPVPLNADQPVRLTPGLSGTADLAMLDEGEGSFVALLALPEYSAPYSVSIASHMIGTLQSPAIFYPRYVTLDADFRPVRRSDVAHFTYRRGLPGGDGLSATIFVNDADRAERYVAVLSARRTDVKTVDSLAQSAGHHQVHIPVKGGFVMWMIPMGGSEKPTPMKALAGGRLTIQLTPYKPKQMGV